MLEKDRHKHSKISLTHKDLMKTEMTSGLEAFKMSDEELAEAEQLLQEEQERDLLYEELLMQNYDFEYGDVIY